MGKKYFKKTFFTLITTLLLSLTFFQTKAYAAYYKATGKISWYYGEGTIGYDGKIISANDCATKAGVDNPPAGTTIYVTDSKTGKKAQFKKYDIGTLSPGVILDLTHRGWVMNFNYNPKDGLFDGSYYHY